MKRKSMITLLMATVMIFSAVSVFAMDYYVPEDAASVTARFFLIEPEAADDQFAMMSEDGELVIHVTDNTLIYFEDFVPLSDDSEGMTQMVREVLFGRTLAEVLEGRNLRVIFEALEENGENDQIEPVSIMVLFEVAVHMPQEINLIDLENGDDGYVRIIPLPEDIVVTPGDFSITLETFDPIILNGEIVVNNVILGNTPLPVWQETASGDVVMVPLRAAAEALGYDVTWNGYLRSVQLGVAVQIWIGNTEVHLGRMAPIQLSTAPVIWNDLTFVPLDFFSNVLGQTVYVFEGQVVIETYSDMM